MSDRRRSSSYSAHVSFGSSGGGSGEDGEAAEKLSLVFEILRLEKSMNNALTSARDEMEGLTKTVSEKEAEAAALEKELEGLRRENEALDAKRGGGASHQFQRGRSSDGSKKGDERKPVRRPSFLPRVKSEGLFGRSFASKQSTNDSQKQPAADASHDSGNDDSVESRPAALTLSALKPTRPASLSRRASIDDPNDPHSAMEWARFDSSGRSDERSALSRRASIDVGLESGAARLRAELSSREERLQELHGEKKANEERLRSLREEEAEGKVISERRLDEHAARMEALQQRKCDVAGSVRDKERLLAEVEGSLKEAEERAAKLERQAEDGQARLRAMERRRLDERREEYGDDGASAEPPSLAQLERDIRECKVRHAVHCTHMKAAVDSLRHVIVVDREDDPSGLLGRRRLADLTEEERDEAGALVDEIAQDVDIQLSNIGRMVADMRDRMEEYGHLSGDGDDHRSSGGDRLMSLSRECAEEFGSFSDEVLRAVSSTSMVLTSAEGSGSAEDDANGGSSALVDDAFGGVGSILESIQRRKEAAELVRQKEGVETKIAIVQGEIKRVQRAMEEETRLHEEVVRRLTSKLDELTERFEIAT